MRKTIVAALATMALAGCGALMGDRLASGAAIGAGAGVVFGGIGAAPGALLGAGVAALTPPEKVNLGQPPWNRRRHR